MKQVKIYFPVALMFHLSLAASAQTQHLPVMETGGKDMPDEWIDKDTRHKVIRLSRKEGSNRSFYFHNNPFIGNKMVFYSTDKAGKQLHTVDLNTLQTEQITNHVSPMNGEIVGKKSKRVNR